MVTIDEFDQFGQYSSLELQHKLRRLKFNNIKNFIEASLNKTYSLYKKNKKSDISFMDYRNLMIKELEKHKNKNNNKPALNSKASNSKIDISFLEEESLHL